jgi:hypothetical protein
VLIWEHRKNSRNELIKSNLYKVFRSEPPSTLTFYHNAEKIINAIFHIERNGQQVLEAGH